MITSTTPSPRRWPGALRWIAAAGFAAVALAGPTTAAAGDVAANVTDGFTIARSSRLGVEVRMSGERDSWCAEVVTVDVIAADPGFFTPDNHTGEGEETSADFRRLVRRLVALLQSECAEIDTVGLKPRKDGGEAIGPDGGFIVEASTDWQLRTVEKYLAALNKELDNEIDELDGGLGAIGEDAANLVDDVERAVAADIVNETNDGEAKLRADEEDIVETLHDASRHSVGAVKQMLAQGADVDARDARGWTPLYYARNAAIAELLIANGADADHRDDVNWAPLHVADTAAIAELLIANGADVNAYSDYHQTPWHTTRGDAINDVLIANGAETGDRPGHYSERLIRKYAKTSKNEKTATNGIARDCFRLTAPPEFGGPAVGVPLAELEYGLAFNGGPCDTHGSGQYENWRHLFDSEERREYDGRVGTPWFVKEIAHSWPSETSLSPVNLFHFARDRARYVQSLRGAKTLDVDLDFNRLPACAVRYDRSEYGTGGSVAYLQPKNFHSEVVQEFYTKIWLGQYELGPTIENNPYVPKIDCGRWAKRMVLRFLDDHDERDNETTLHTTYQNLYEEHDLGDIWPVVFNLPEERYDLPEGAREQVPQRHMFLHKSFKKLSNWAGLRIAIADECALEKKKAEISAQFERDLERLSQRFHVQTQIKATRNRTIVDEDHSPICFFQCGDRIHQYDQTLQVAETSKDLLQFYPIPHYGLSYLGDLTCEQRDNIAEKYRRLQEILQNTEWYDLEGEEEWKSLIRG